MKNLNNLEKTIKTINNIIDLSGIDKNIIIEHLFNNLDSWQKETKDFIEKQQNNISEEEQLFFELTKNIVIKTDEKEYPNKIFYFKNDNCIFEYNKNNGYFYCNYDEYWSKFYEKFNLNYNQVKDLTKDMVEKHFKLYGITPPLTGFVLF